MNITFNDAIRHIGQIIKNDEPVTVLCGAGISKAPPASAPDWTDLRNRLLTALLWRLETAHVLHTREITQLMRSFNNFQKKNRIWIKPELMLNWFHQTLGDRLFDSFGVLELGEPNINHHIIASICRKFLNVQLVTTNFDLYFERVLKESVIVFGASRALDGISPYAKYTAKPNYSSGKVRLLKIHGSLCNKASIKATLQQVGKKMLPKTRDCFESTIKHRHVIVVGYSGNDYDLFPILEASASRTRSFMWLHKPKMKRDEKLSRLEASGTMAVEADLDSFIPDLGSLLGIAAPKFVVDRSQRRRDTTLKTRETIKTYLRQWTDRLDVHESAMALARFGMHIGFFKLTEVVCKRLLKSIQYERAILFNSWALTYKRRNPKKAFELYRQALRCAAHDRKRYYGNVLGNIGALYHEIGRHKLAARYLRASTHWARKAGNIGLIHMNNDDYGNALRGLGRPGQALQYHRLAYRYRHRSGRLLDMALLLNNIALAYMALGRYVVAEQYLRRSLDLKRRETADVPATARGLLTMGITKAELGNLNESKKCFHDAMDLSRQQHDYPAIVVILYGLADTHCRMGDHTKSKVLLKKADRLLRRYRHSGKDLHDPNWIRKIRNRIFHTRTKR